MISDCSLWSVAGARLPAPAVSSSDMLGFLGTGGEIATLPYQFGGSMCKTRLAYGRPVQGGVQSVFGHPVFTYNICQCIVPV